MDILSTTEDPRFRELALAHLAGFCRMAKREQGRRLYLVYRDLAGHDGMRAMKGETARDLVAQIESDWFREEVATAYAMHDPHREAVLLLWPIGGGLGLLVVRFAELAEGLEDLPDVPVGAGLN